jgi:hypothetical protein
MNCEVETRNSLTCSESAVGSMSPKGGPAWAIAVLALGLTGSPCELGASTLSWQYRLIEGSEWVDDCPVCARPTLSLPLRGEFMVVLVEENPLSSRYEVRDVRLHTGTGANWDYRLTGSGMLEMGGEVEVVLEMRLDLRIEGDGTSIDRVFTNAVETVSRPWPMLDVSLSDVEGTPLQTYRLTLRAAPLREIWFSTVNGMTSGNSDPPFARILPGDLLSGDGRVVRANQDLVGQLGFMAPIPEVGVDAFEVQPGGELWFSLGESIFSETLGMLREGDLLSEQGRGQKEPAIDRGLSICRRTHGSRARCRARVVGW